MQINKIGMNQGIVFAQEEKNNGDGLDPNGHQRLKRLIIVDEVDISKIGQALLDHSKKSDLFNPDEVKEIENNYDLLESKSPEAFIDQVFIEDVLIYKENYMALKGGHDEAAKVEALNHTYLEKLQANIEEIAQTLDQYFDKGRTLYDTYSKEPLSDLFDKEAFKVNLKNSVLKVRDSVMAREDIHTENIQKEILANQGSSSVENLSYETLKTLYSFAKEPVEFDDSIDQYDSDHIEKIARKEKDLNHRIGLMDLPDHVKKSMYEVNRRVSEGLLRHVSYKTEQENNKYQMEEYNRMLKHLAEMLKQLGINIEEIEELFGINPENKLLLKNLERQEELTARYNDIRALRDSKELEMKDLEKNKYKVTETESYKKAKSAYESEMAKEDIA